MNIPPEHLICLPLDLNQIHKLLPTLISIATELDAIPQRYRELYDFFRQQYLNLFTGHNSQVMVHERVGTALARLHDLTRDVNLVEGPLNWLELNNDRTALTCDMLALLFSKPPELGVTEHLE